MKKQLVFVAILTVLVAFMDISGLPAALFIDISIADIEPVYFALMINFLIIGVISYFYLKFLCPEWQLGFKIEGLSGGFKQYGLLGVLVALAGFKAFFIGLYPFDRTPSVAKVIVEGIVYYIGVAIVEEFYVRGLLLNFIEKLFDGKKRATPIAVISSAVIFGVGHIFGTLNEPPLVIIAKVVWTVGMGIFFGTVYKKTNNLWLPIIFHFLVNVCALPYQFSSVSGYADITLYIIVPVYIALGVYSVIILNADKKQNLH